MRCTPNPPTKNSAEDKYEYRLALAVHFVHYNFARIHQTLRVTPAMAAGLTDHVWELAELIALLEIDERRLAA